MSVDPWALLATARVARFASISARTGAPTLIPVTFAIAGETLVHAVDHKPKRTRELARLANVRADPRASLLADEYDDEDWNQLWWVRADGTARVLDDAPDYVDLLVARYPQYRAQRPSGPVIALDVEHITSWRA
ncbi:hypothetical protein DSM104299_03003 [Baekduia alba]|uniref:TIGR03668 family PPOX class F420-dependent oxidoreductase n=1 Tax=Baekduia alba TaxID=2997333 RepID=UPI00234115D4|nr:TIGR03668 family PPOX class F420-dependent oxidoreductase [Baekduia alba]WCB94271.1 hypothetical protein DSM104299_03003 [Baekduia alba]